MNVSGDHRLFGGAPLHLEHSASPDRFLSWTIFACRSTNVPPSSLLWTRPERYARCSTTRCASRKQNRGRRATRIVLGMVLPTQVAKLYNLPQIEGAGQRVAVLEFRGGFDQSVIADHLTQNIGLSTPLVVNAVSKKRKFRRPVKGFNVMMAGAEFAGLAAATNLYSLCLSLSRLDTQRLHGCDCSNRSFCSCIERKVYAVSSAILSASSFIPWLISGFDNLALAQSKAIAASNP
jgi:hypothetical protein